MRHYFAGPTEWTAMTLFVCIDDTDTLDSERGTGRQGRRLLARLAEEFPGLDPAGVVRQQLLVDPEVPYTTHNSCACLRFEPQRAPPDDDAIEAVAGEFLRTEAADGSDPGLCIATAERVTDAVVDFGHRAGEEVLTESEAYDLATAAGVHLDEYGGTGEGVIGALAGVGRTATGDVGRFVDYGDVREFEGLVDVAALRDAGLRVRTEDGEEFHEGTVDSRDWVRPTLRGGDPVLVVTERDGRWVATNALER
jgi:tRNA(Ile2) C34 agmatinyltransferase TiaS